ncbi:uncharacterized protein [Panulirus ornatus]|uniref:uncharacterized protein isoform X3 n=1 Tax=Panulirus ornatus TaxID=150431 RepID=UPI003A8516F1
MSGGLTAAGLLVLLLAFIGFGVGIYYAYMCLRARPLRPKQPTDSEHGPLITPDPDVNGNHEDAPLEASAPVDDVGNTKHKLPLDEPDASNTVKSPVSDLNDANKHTGSPKDKDDILVPIEDEVPPAKLIHEKEAMPTLNHVAPLGFVAPTVIVPQDTSDHHPLPKHTQDRPDAEVHPSRNTPAPVYVPVPCLKKPVISDEEDGLLMQECLPEDDSLDPDQCPKLTPPGSQEEVPNTTLNEEPIANNTPASDPSNIVVPQPTLENAQPKAPAENPPSTAVPESAQLVPASHSPEPEIIVAAQQEPVDVQKENLSPVEKAIESVPLDVSVDVEPSPALMKEDVEQLQPVQDAEDSVPTKEVKHNDPVENTTGDKDLEPELKAVHPEEPALIQESPDESNKALSTPLQPDDSMNVPETETAKPLPETSEKTPEESVECSPVVYLETSQPLEKSRSNSESSVSSEEAVPPYTEEISERNPSSIEAAESSDVVSPTTSLVSSLDGDEQPQAADSCEPVLVSDSSLEISTDVPPEASSGIPPETSSEIPTEDSSDSVGNSFNSPIESQSDDFVHASSDIPLESSPDIPLESSDVPLEAYIPGSDNQYDLDLVEEDDTSLPVIKEEGSADNESESNETDSSEPEVSEYSFSSGPSAPSTSVILADEVSCSLEPEVTKYLVIPEVEVSHDTDLGESDHADDDQDVDSVLLPEVGNSESNKPAVSIASDEGEINSSNPYPSKEEPDSSSVLPQPSVENTKPSRVTLEDSAVLETAAVTTSNDLSLQLPDSTSTLSNQEESSSESSEVESDGEQAEPDVREEEVKVPTAVHKEPSECITTAGVPTVSSNPPISSVANDSGSPVLVCDPNPQNSHTAQMPNKSVEDNSGSTEENVSSSSPPSTPSDLSDEDIPISTPKKSKIPRLVNHNES